MPSVGAEAARLSVRVQPRASRNAILGWCVDVLRVTMTAPPVQGEANQAVARLLARALGVAPSMVSVARGERSRDKVVRIAGVTDAEARSRLAGREGHALSRPSAGPAIISGSSTRRGYLSRS